MLYSSHSSSFFSDLLLLVIAIRLIYKINLFVLKTIGIEIHRIEWKSIIIVMLSMPIGNVSSTTILVGSYLNAPLIVCLSVCLSVGLLHYISPKSDHSTVHTYNIDHCLKAFDFWCLESPVTRRIWPCLVQFLWFFFGPGLCLLRNVLGTLSHAGNDFSIGSILKYYLWLLHKFLVGHFDCGSIHLEFQST